jgi:nicotinate-nucleotide--dimethylbenzimidazole phosphoribosyltransferase
MEKHMSDASFDSLTEFQALLVAGPQADMAAVEGAKVRNGQLTKPPGALGRLEDLAIWYAGWRGTDVPTLDTPQVVVFAGNHGISTQGVSAFPAEVTAQMVLNFQHGGAAINQICKTFGAKLEVYALELDRPTDDFTKGPAMSEIDFVTALKTGWNAVDASADLLVVGEMGIGNTTSAAAISHALYGGEPTDWVGRGTGVDDAGLALKAAVVKAGLQANPKVLGNGLEALRCLGGRELAAMAGAIVCARANSIPVIMDGFICSAAAACLEVAKDGALDHVVAGHLSGEGAHKLLLGKMAKDPILSLGLRLGEASGAALAIGVMKAAVACHSGMATFAEAGVTDT